MFWQSSVSQFELLSSCLLNGQFLGKQFKQIEFNFYFWRDKINHFAQPDNKQVWVENNFFKHLKK